MAIQVLATPCHGRPCQEGPYLVIPATRSKSESALARLESPWIRIAATDQRIVMQKASLLTGFGGEIQPGRVDGEDPDGEQGDFLNGLTESRQRLHLGRMVPKPHGDAGRGQPNACMASIVISR